MILSVVSQIFIFVTKIYSHSNPDSTLRLVLKFFVYFFVSAREINFHSHSLMVVTAIRLFCYVQIYMYFVSGCKLFIILATAKLSM
jgi:hypothetical protein